MCVPNDASSAAYYTALMLSGKQKEEWKWGNTKDRERGGRSAEEQEKEREQVETLGVNQEVLKENWIRCC